VTTRKGDEKKKILSHELEKKKIIFPPSLISQESGSPG